MSAGLRVAVVGGGVVGRSLARAMARAGHRVVLADAGREAASRVPVALLNPHRGRTGRAHPDDLTALARAWRWAAELEAEGLDPGTRRSGVVRVADGPAQARAFAAAGLPTIAAADAGVRAPHGAFLVADGGWVDPGAHLAALTASARRGGARVREATSLVAADRGSDGAWRLRFASDLEDAGTEVVDVVVLATGAAPWPEALVAAFGPQPAFERVAGDVLVTRAPAPARPLAGATYVGPVARTDAPGADGTGAPRRSDQRARAAVGGHHRPPGPPAPDAAARLRSAVGWALPELAAPAADDRVWWGVRARAADGRPQLSWCAPDALWVGGFAGRGFLAAAEAAEAAAAMIADRRK